MIVNDRFAIGCCEQHRHRRARLPALAAFACMLALLLSPATRAEEPPLRLATSTTAYGTGLIDRLKSEYEAHSGVRLDVLAVGSGRALLLGRRNEADVLLTHAPAAEKSFVAEGFGASRNYVMHNDFVIVGPADDPAGIRGLEDGVEAFRRIAAREAAFVSRGDQSGSHLRENDLWQQAGIRPYGLWYREVGMGMKDTLTFAGNRQSYLLVDRGTWLSRGIDDRLTLLVEGDPRFLNIYSVIPVVGSASTSGVNARAVDFANWLTSDAVAELIRSFRPNGEQLFFVDRGIIDD